MKTKLLFTFIHSFLLLSAIINATNNTTYTSIVLNPVANPVDDLIACDDGSGIGFDDGIAAFDTTNVEIQVLDDQTNVTVTYIDGNGNPLPSPLPNPLLNSIPFQETITVTVTDNSTGEMAITTFDLIVNAIPDIPQGLSLSACDSDNDGIVSFDTSGIESEILGGQTGLNVTYVDGAGNPLSSPLPNPFFNITPGGETLVATVTNPITGCFSTTTIILAVVSTIATNPEDVTECDNDLDGVASFNLLSLNPIILNGQNPTIFFVSYHTSTVDASADINAIVTPDMYVSTGEIIYARVDNGLNPGESTCNAITSFNLLIASPPTVAVPEDLEVCGNDGIFNFELSLQNELFDGDDSTLTVSYHFTQEDADNGILEIDQTSFINNDLFIQTIYVRVENPEGCFTVVPYTLQILNTPILNEHPEAILLCDINSDGFESFDLTIREEEILDDLDPLLFTFEWFITLTDAQAGFPSLGNPTAFATMSTTVYGVVTEEGQSAATRCPSDPVALELIVEELPLVPGLMERVEVCDDEASGSNTDGLTIFDLNTLNNEITDGDVNLNVAYHIDQASADAGTPELINPYTIGSQGTGLDETLFVRVEDLTTGCFITTTITLAVIPLPSPSPIPPVEKCDNNDGVINGLAVFDLTDPSISVTIINDEPITITFHETEQDAVDGVNEIIDPTAYSAPDGTVLYVRALNNMINDFTLQQCFNVITITLIVSTVPDLPDNLPIISECDIDGDGIVTVDLTQNEALIFDGNPPGFILTYHLSEIDALDGTNAIAASELMNFTITANTTIWVRLEDNSTGCFNTISFEVQIINDCTDTDGDGIIDVEEDLNDNGDLEDDDT